MALFGLIDKSTLYFPGCHSSAFFEGKIENYKKILKKLGIKFWMPHEFLCCGGFLNEAGYETHFNKTARENLNFLKGKGVKKIITSCSLCTTIFSESYIHAVSDWSIESEHILTTILNKILANNTLIQSYSKEDIVYYDSCYMGRYSRIHNAPRDILKLIGYNVREFPDSRGDTICCGSCGGLPITNSELSKQVAENFIAIMKRNGIKKIVTADSRVYKHLRNNLNGEDINNLEIIEISALISEALGIKPE